MKRTLVLVVDRDDDFGIKANVETPVIGSAAIARAASALGVVDPEDSDINTIYAAIKIYNELRADDIDAEVALICGDTKVGHRSDMKVADELDIVLAKVKPDRAILVSDGAEDEHVYPMITSRIKVDSVRKVYVKQAPGLEGAFYVLTRILKDNDKRKRLLAPIGFILMAITAIMMAPLYLDYRTGGISNVYNATGIIIVFVIGLIICLYAYRVGERMWNYILRLVNNLKSGDPTVIFTIVAAALFCIGIVLGATAAMGPVIDDGQRVIIFLSNSLWVMAFAYICNDFGRFLERYIEQNRVSLGFMVGTLMIFAAAFIIQASLDFLAVVFAYDIIGQDMIIIEYMIGLAFAAAAGLTQSSYKRFLLSRKEEEVIMEPLDVV
jgi:putative membrane protein